MAGKRGIEDLCGISNKVPKQTSCENGKEEITTMYDLKKSQEDLEEEALFQSRGNWGDENKCTYGEGYKSQAVYACKTCSEKSSQLFGFCFGCSLKCHITEEHQVFELFRKKGFRCDCGTPRSGCKCSFDENQHKSQNNSENRYGHNFKGLYCWCNKPYEENQTMYQCIICDDWFHKECIESKHSEPIPDDEEPTDFICNTCVEKNSFLLKYDKLVKDNVDVEPCKIQNTPIPAKSSFPNIFMKDGWRSLLCQCLACLKMYDEHHVTFLFDAENEEDLLESKETSGSTSLFESSQTAFSSVNLPFTVKSDLTHGMNSFISLFKEWVQANGFVGPNAPEVTKKDIENFQEFLNKKKDQSRQL